MHNRYSVYAELRPTGEAAHNPDTRLDDGFENEPRRQRVATTTGDYPDAPTVIARTTARPAADAVDYVVMLDAHGRHSIQRETQNRDHNARVVPPTFLCYIRYDNDLISRIDSWNRVPISSALGPDGYHTVDAAWEWIPVDCSDLIDVDLLP